MKAGITKYPLPPAFAKALKLFGSLDEISRRTNRSVGQANKWAKKGKIPGTSSAVIEQLTKGKIKAMDLILGK